MTTPLLTEQLAQQSTKKARAVKPPVAVGVRYRAALRKLNRDIKSDIDEQLKPALQRLAPEYTRDGWSEQLLSIIQRIKAKYSGSQFIVFAQAISSQFVKTADNVNRKKFDASMKSVGLDLFGDSPELVEYVQASINANTQLITSIPNKYLEQVETMVMANTRAGLRPSAITKQLQKQFELSENRAKLIARDQTAKLSGDLAEKRQRSVGYDYFQWIDSGDERVRDRHEFIADKVTAYGRGIYRWDNLPISDNGVTIKPGSDFQCFTGDSPVNLFYGAKKAFRHLYSGELTHLVSSSGDVFVCTSNHPVLTDVGFVAAKFIDVGHNIVKVPNQTFSVADSNTKSSNIEFSKLFHAFQLIGVTHKPATTLGSDFHGDAQNQEVDVISFDWELPSTFNPVLVKQFFELLLPLTDKVVVDGHTSRFSDIGAVLNGLTGASDSVVRSACKLLSFLSAGFAHPCEHSFASVGLLYSALVQNSSDDVARSVEFLSDCFDTELSVEHRFNLFKRYMLLVMRYAFGFGDHETPGAQRFTEVVGVTVEEFSDGSKRVPVRHESFSVVEKFTSVFSGHVYNLEMGEGLFISQNVAVSNCRCIARPVSNAEVEKNQKEGRVNPSVKR